ncbi:hypothetical protein DKX38_005766 [Salix brachista]|uniref:UTP--glucose-1-phosphate uridylyltransferase n=1 Tax=Salix brachista TaxID=2182728 RepID=A0A5N5N0K8_9ROSI|nr:hypothetical protein DKX38_005766 [Salix brachista]
MELTIKLLQNLNKKYGCSVPLLLMNSFNTRDNTQKVPDPYLFSPALYPPEHGKLDALLSWVDALMFLLLYPCDIQKVKSMCLLPAQLTSVLLLI